MARTRIARFNIMITASAEQVRGVFGNVGKQAASFASSLGGIATNAAFAFNQITEAAGKVARVMIDIGSAIAEVAAEMDEFGKRAERLQVAPEFLQQFALSARFAGVEVDRVGDALRDFQARIGQLRAGTGTEVAAGLRALGLEDLRGTFQQNLQVVLNGLSQIEDFATRAAIAEKFFGEVGRDLVAAIDPGSLTRAADAFERIGGAIGTEQFQNVSQLNDQITLLQQSLQIAIETVVAELAPIITDVLKLLTVTFQGLTRATRQYVQTVTTDLVTLLRSLADTLENIFGPAFLAGFDVALRDAASIIESGNKLREAFDQIAAPAQVEAIGRSVQQTAEIVDGIDLNDLMRKWQMDLLQRQAEQAANNIVGTVRGIFEREPVFRLAIGGAGAFQAGSVQAASRQFGRIQSDQLTQLKAIEKNTRAGSSVTVVPAGVD